MAINVARNSQKFAEEYINILCDPCRFNGKTTVALKNCQTCSGNLCQNCVNLHMKNVNTKNHITSFIILTHTGSGKIKMAASQDGKNVDIKCADHSKQVVSYCARHEALCCRVCIGSIHRECKLQGLSDAANKCRKSREVRNTETFIKRLHAKFKDIQRDKQANLHHLDQLNETFVSALKTHRRTLNNLLDKLEQAVVKRKDRHFDTKCEEIRGCLKTTETAIGALNGSLTKLDIASKQGDDQTMFLTLKTVQAVTKRYETVYSDLEKYPKHYTFYFQPDASVEKFLKSLAELGRVRDDSVPHNGLQTSWKLKDKYTVSAREPRHSETDEKDLDNSISHYSPQTSWMVMDKHSARELRHFQTDDEFNVPHSLNKLGSPRKQIGITSCGIPSDKLNVRLQSDKKTCSITGSAFLADDKIVVTDATNKKVKAFGADLKPLSFLETTSAPRDVTPMTSSSEAAFTMPNEKSFQIITIRKEISIKRTIKLNVECYGISFHDNAFYLASGWSTNKEILVVGCEGMVLRTLKPNKGILKCPLYVAVDPKLSHVFVSDYDYGVIGMDMNGTVIFRYQETTAKGYMGLCSTPGGDVYVCTFQPNGVSRVQTDNKHFGSLTTFAKSELEPLITLPNNGAQRARSVAYSRKNNKIMISFVGQNVDTLSIYQL